MALLLCDQARHEFDPRAYPRCPRCLPSPERFLRPSEGIPLAGNSSQQAGLQIDTAPTLTAGPLQETRSAISNGLDTATSVALKKRFLPKQLLLERGHRRLLLAKERYSGREVSVVVLKKSALEHPQVIAHFIREAVLTARLQHPNVVAVHELPLLDPPHPLYYTTRPMHSTSFTQQLQSTSLRENLTILRDAARALHHAHSHGYWHGVLTGDCLARGFFDETFVTGWGQLSLGIHPEEPLTITAVGQTFSSDVTGPPQDTLYLSPELAKDPVSAPPDRRADVWSMGILMYQALCGVHPLGKLQPEAAKEALCNSPTLPPPGDGRAFIPEMLNDLCVQMLKPDPAKRMPDLAPFLETLNLYLEARPGMAGGTRSATGQPYFSDGSQAPTE